MVLGFGNGIGSGIVMRLGADSAPHDDRTRFLGIWRMLVDLGASGGPLLLSITLDAEALYKCVQAGGAVEFQLEQAMLQVAPSAPFSG